MNAFVKYSVENFDELLKLENKVIADIIHILSTEEPQIARIRILKIREALIKNIEADPNIKPLLRTFQYGLEGAFFAALECLSAKSV